MSRRKNWMLSRTQSNILRRESYAERQTGEHNTKQEKLMRKRI